MVGARQCKRIHPKLYDAGVRCVVFERGHSWLNRPVKKLLFLIVEAVLVFFSQWLGLEDGLLSLLCRAELFASNATADSLVILRGGHQIQSTLILISMLCLGQLLGRSRFVYVT